MLALSLGLTGLSALRLSRNPLLKPYVDVPLNEIAARSEAIMAREATPELVVTRLKELLAEEPRNWVAIQAVEAIAVDRGVDLPTDLAVKRAEFWESDSGYLAIAGRCGTCMWDAGTCTISNALMCYAPITLTPIGDVIGLSKAGTAWATGGDVDEIDLGLSVIGLGATAAVLASGGTSYTLKIGSGLLKLARKMRLLSPRLTGMLADVIRRGIDWQLITRMDFSEPSKLIRSDVVAPIAHIASDMGRMGAKLPMTETLHLLRYVDDADDARHLANAAEALGPKTLGRIELLGKARFLRATVHLSELAIQMALGLVGLFLSLAGVLGGFAQTSMIRLLRRLAREPRLPRQAA